ncbi:Uncharacterised protein [Mycobacteroides abscessus subsp. abscessus]|nr:Uncharacterised protein [Mycobacteroides abscessus subsp. abscessus]
MTIHTALTFSPRARARIDQATAPSIAIPARTAFLAGVMGDRSTTPTGGRSGSVRRYSIVAICYSW